MERVPAGIANTCLDTDGDLTRGPSADKCAGGPLQQPETFTPSCAWPGPRPVRKT